MTEIATAWCCMQVAERVGFHTQVGRGGAANGRGGIGAVRGWLVRGDCGEWKGGIGEGIRGFGGVIGE